MKDMQIKKMEETIHGLEYKMKERDIRNKNLQEKVSYQSAHLKNLCLYIVFLYMASTSLVSI